MQVFKGFVSADPAVAPDSARKRKPGGIGGRYDTREVMTLGDTRLPPLIKHYRYRRATSQVTNVLGDESAGERVVGGRRNRWPLKTDEQIDTCVDAARQGDTSAFGAIARHCMGAVERAVFRVFPHTTWVDYEALVADALMDGFQKFPEFRGPGSPCAYLAKFGEHKALNQRRKHARRGEDAMATLDDLGGASRGEAVISSHAQVSTPEGEVVAHDMRNWLMRNLPPEQAETLALRAFDDLKYDEIAEVMMVSAKTVSSRITRARRTALELLDRERRRGDSP